jgi:outer membrane protein TolC
MLASVRVALAAALFLILTPRGVHPAEDAPSLGVTSLERGPLVQAVLARNLSAAIARAALRAAEARAEAAGAFADPRLSYALAPRSLSGRGGHRVELAWPIATFGKRGLARDVANAEAEASAHELAAVRLELALAASQLYDDRYLVARALALNARHRTLVEDLRQAALARYEAGEAARQAPLAAELEAARLEHREVELGALARVTAARINALLHRAPNAELPPPPSHLEIRAAGSSDAAERPELRAAEARLRASERALALARRERMPDLALMAGYDGMWDEPDMRPMVGVELELPIARDRRRAQISAAEAARDAAREEHERARSELSLERAIARERLAEAQHSLAVIREQMLPAARDQAETAVAALETGRGDFADAIEAERAYYETELAAEEALAETSRRSAELARAEGRIPQEELR